MCPLDDMSDVASLSIFHERRKVREKVFPRLIGKFYNWEIHA